MIRQTTLALALTVAGAILASAPAVAEMRSSSWTVGSLSPAIPSLGADTFTRSDLPSLLGDKLRLGGVAVPSLGDGAMIRSWLSPSLSNGLQRSLSGVLLDMPFGDFRLTPSVGAGFTENAVSSRTLEIRSQLELGYEFENRSRFTLGISRTSDDRSRAGGSPNDVFGLYYRLPLGR